MAIIVLEYVPFDSHSHWQKLSTRSIATSDKGGKLLRSQMSALDAILCNCMPILNAKIQWEHILE